MNFIYKTWNKINKNIPKLIFVFLVSSILYQSYGFRLKWFEPVPTHTETAPALGLEIITPNWVPRNSLTPFFLSLTGKRLAPLSFRLKRSPLQSPQLNSKLTSLSEFKNSTLYFTTTPSTDRRYLLQIFDAFIQDNEDRLLFKEYSFVLNEENPVITLWIWVSPQHASKEVFVWVQDDKGVRAGPYPLQVESTFRYGFIRALHILFGIPFLTAVGVLLGVFKFLEERRKELQHRLQQQFQTHLTDLRESPIEMWGKTYLTLWNFFPERWAREQLKRERPRGLEHTIGQPWLLSWKEEALKKLKAQILDKELLPQDLPETFEPARKAVALFQEVRTEGENGTVDPEKAIQLIHLWGLGIVDWLLEQPWLQRLSQEDLRKIYYGSAADRSAAGRFLILRLKAEKSISIPEEWLRDPSPPHPLRPPLSLWPDAPPPILEEEGSLIENPFGPERAEEDPRLPLPFRRGDPENSEERGGGLFWEGHPAWKEVQGEGSTWFRVTPGAGTSALIWMGRHVYSYWGRRPALSLYLPLRGNASPEALTFALEQALFEALLQTLIQDPIWFLRLDPVGQRQIVAFLARRQRVEELLELLQKGGLPQGELNLVADIFWTQALGSAFSTTLPSLPTFILQIHEWMARNALHVRATPDRSFGLRLWIELPPSTAKDAPQWSTFLSQDETVWSLGTVKVFAHEEKPEGLKAVVEHNLRWTPGELETLFRHRIEQTPSVPEALTSIGIGNPWEAFRSFLADRGEKEPSTPKELIRAGNRWLGRMWRQLRANAPGVGTEG